MESSRPEYCRYELNVEGMTCVKCTEKIEKALNELPLSIQNLKVDFISNRVLLTIPSGSSVEVASQKLEASGFRVKGSKDISYDVSNDQRTLQLQILKGGKDTLLKAIKDNAGFLPVELPKFSANICTINYNPNKIRGSEIVKKLNESEEVKNGSLLFKIEDFFEDKTSSIEFSEFTSLQLKLVLILNVLSVIASLIKNHHYIMAPHSFGIFSYYFMAVLVLTLVTVKLVAISIYKNSFKQLISNLNINMMTLVSIGSGLALIFGLVYTLWGGCETMTGSLKDPHYFIMNATEMFFTSTTILTAVVVGKYIEGKIKEKVVSRIEDLKSQLKVNVSTVTRILPRNKRFVALSVEELHPMLVEKDDYILIKAPGMIPFDGFLEKGTLKIVENIQYGWEKVETKTKGHPIMSGSQVIHVLEEAVIRVTEPLEKTLAGRLFHEIKEAASGSSCKGKTGDILSYVTKYFITVVLVVAALTFIGWSLAFIVAPEEVKDYRYSYPFEKAIAVLVAACPCGLGIAIPMLYAIALRKGFKAGVLIKDTSSLDTLSTVDSVVFDKTGTITGTYNIQEVQNVHQRYDDASLWEMVSILEKDHLQHPIGLALFQEALQMLSRLEKSKHTITKDEHSKNLQEYFASEGVVDKSIKVDSESKQISLGGEKLLKRLEIQIPNVQKAHEALEITKHLSSEATEEDPSTKVKLYLCIDSEVHFIITLSLEETLKNNVVKLISTLKQNKKEIFILSGDKRANAVQVGQQLGIPVPNIYAELAPGDKERYITDFIKRDGRKVMMVGDGMNDIKAFKAATVSCSINFKSSQNLTFSDFIIIDNDVENISGVFTLASALIKFKAVILACALLYNIPTILAATGAFVTLMGIDLPAFMAAWAMVASSIFLTLIANLMDFVVIKQDSKRVSVFTKQLQKTVSRLSERKNSSNKHNNDSTQDIEMSNLKAPLISK